MANNRELSQLGSFIVVDDTTKNIGIATTATPYVGIGTINPQAKLHVVGDVLVTGVVTATSFSGDGSNLFNVQSSSIVGITTFASKSGIATNVIGGIASVTQLNVSGVSTFTGISTFGNNVSIANNLDVNGNINFNGDLFQDNQPFIASRWSATTTGGDIYRLSNVGIGTTIPTSKLHVVGDGNFTGVVTATAFFGSGYNLTDSINSININKIEGIGIRDEGSLVGSGATFTSLNFIGSGVVATGIGSTAVITINSSAGGEIFIQEEGVQVGVAVTTINIVGPKITAINSGVGIATISINIDQFPFGDYGNLDATTTDSFGIALSYAFDCLTQPEYSLITYDLQ